MKINPHKEDEDEDEDEDVVTRRQGFTRFIYHFDDEGAGAIDGCRASPEQEDVHAMEDVPTVAGPSHDVYGPGRVFIDLTGIDGDDASCKEKEKGKGKKEKGKKRKRPSSTVEVIDLMGDDD